jgi:hypothetical protein
LTVCANATPGSARRAATATPKIPARLKMIFPSLVEYD